jgi:hypothetical protein
MKNNLKKNLSRKSFGKQEHDYHGNSNRCLEQIEDILKQVEHLSVVLVNLAILTLQIILAFNIAVTLQVYKN